MDLRNLMKTARLTYSEKHWSIPMVMQISFLKEMAIRKVKPSGFLTEIPSDWEIGSETQMVIQMEILTRSGSGWGSQTVILKD